MISYFLGWLPLVPRTFILVVFYIAVALLLVQLALWFIKLLKGWTPFI